MPPELLDLPTALNLRTHCTAQCFVCENLVATFSQASIDERKKRVANLSNDTQPTLMLFFCWLARTGWNHGWYFALPTQSCKHWWDRGATLPLPLLWHISFYPTLYYLQAPLPFLIVPLALQRRSNSWSHLPQECVEFLSNFNISWRIPAREMLWLWN